MKAEFGIRLPVSGPLASPDGIARIAKEAESYGFDSICVHDHLVIDREARYHFSAGLAESVDDRQEKGLSVTDFYEATTTLAYAAGLTKRVKLGPSAFVLPWRHPVLFAKQSATLQELSCGRFTPALCIGRYPAGFEATNLPFKERGRIFDEALELLKLLLSSDKEVLFNGRYFKCRIDPICPRPVDLPLWIGGGHNRIVYRRVARYCRGFLASGTPEQFERSKAGIAEEMRRQERSEHDFRMGRQTFLCLKPSVEEARGLVDQTLHMFYHAPQFNQIRDQMIEETLQTSLIGDPGHVVKAIDEYLRAGVVFSEMRLIGVRDLNEATAMMELFADQVAPSFR